MKITIQADISVAADKAWKIWTDPAHIVHWNAASDDWHTPRAENDVRTGGTFNFRMESKDGKMGFDLKGNYTLVESGKRLEYYLEDNREVWVSFINHGESCLIKQGFDPEQTHSRELQELGWQSILNNFKKYAEQLL